MGTAAASRCSRTRWPTPIRTVTSALPFSHDEEIDRPHLYSVVLDDGVHPPVAAELTAGSHSVWLRATYGGDTGSLVFDQIDGDGFLDLPEPVPGGDTPPRATSTVRAV